MKNFWRLWNKVIITTRRELPLIPSYQKLWKPENGTKARLPKVPLGSATVGIKTPKYADEKNKWNLCVLKIGTGVTQVQNPERYSIQISDTHLFLFCCGDSSLVNMSVPWPPHWKPTDVQDPTLRSNKRWPLGTLLPIDQNPIGWVHQLCWRTLALYQTKPWVVR